MAESSRTFNFDDFDQQIADALAGNDEAMATLIPIRRPGEIGAVVTHLTFNPEVPEPPDAA